MEGEFRDSRTYIDVMHEQIGDSLAESEREVMKVIEQIGLLNAQASEKRAHINRSIQSGKALTESTRLRVEANHEIIAALEMQLQEQNDEMRSNFERIEGLADEVRTLTPLIKVITSIAQQTSLLALNAEIEAARAGSAGVASPWWPLRLESCRFFHQCRCRHCREDQCDLQTSGHRDGRRQGLPGAVRIEHRHAKPDRRAGRNATGVHEERRIAACSHLRSGLKLRGEYPPALRGAGTHSVPGCDAAENGARAGSAGGNARTHAAVERKGRRPGWDGQLDQTFKSLLASHLDQYRMASQTNTHLAVSGGFRRRIMDARRLSCFRDLRSSRCF